MSSIPHNPQLRAQMSVAMRTSAFLHPDYDYWASVWEMIRDAEIGEIEVKRKTTKYLPKQQGQDDSQYRSYLQRAVFYNMTAKTLNSLYGTMFKRNPNLTGLPRALRERTKRFSKDGMSLHLTAKTAIKEVLALGRYGMLVDASTDGAGAPYVACYTAENILDWHREEVNGEYKYTRVVLREVGYAKDRSVNPLQTKNRYRVLLLTESDDGSYFYEQHVYDEDESWTLPNTMAIPDEIIIPTVRGEPLDYIPFVVIGPFTNHPEIQKPPLLDIVNLNFSHYQSYTILEQARYYTAQPVYYTTTSASDDEGVGDYYVGPDVVWELGKDGKAGIIEFSGHGLNSLEKALEQKESQIAAIGGRMMPGSATGAAESDNSLKLKEQNEQTLLLNIADTSDEGFTQVIQWWADWNNVPDSTIRQITFELNRDFLLRDIGAREFRAIHQMYADGIIPVDVVYEYLRKAEVIPDWMDLEEYKTLLADTKQFPHMVDVLARMKNFPDAQAFHDYRVMREEAASVPTTEVTGRPEDPRTPPVPGQARRTGRVRTPGQS